MEKHRPSSTSDAARGPGTAPGSGLLGLVLAGGASRRMGRDKAQIPLPDGTGPAAPPDVAPMNLTHWAARRLARVCDPVLIADRGRGIAPGWPSVADGPGRGPAAAILGGSRARPGRPLLALACDLPGVPVALLEALVARATEGPGGRGGPDWVAPRGALGPEPLCTLYGPRALELLEERVEAGHLALRGLLDDPRLQGAVLPREELRELGDPDLLLTNLNRPEDLERWRGKREADLD